MSIRRHSRLLVLCIAGLAFTTSARADDDALAPYRDRFRLGMEKYKAGGIAEAIRVWSAIYEEIGPTRGYRLSFNLATAYDTNGEATRAAERYRSFLDEAEVRRTAGEALEPLVVREVEEAKVRFEDLKRGHGRIEIAVGADPTLTQVDDTDPRLGAFTAYVAPGKHLVTFGPGLPDAEKVEVTVAAGEVVVAHATRPVRPHEPVVLPTVDPVFTTRRIIHHPFSPIVLYVGGVVTAASILAPALAYGQADSLYNKFIASNSSTSTKNSVGADYNGARTLAYGLLAVPITLGAVTGGLTTWYFAGAEPRTVTISFDAGPVPGGYAASLSGRF